MLHRCNNLRKICMLLLSTGMFLFVLSVRSGFTIQKTGSLVTENQQKEPARVALTFDDGPSVYTAALSTGLKKRGVKATFFLLGENMEGHRDEVCQLVNDGHLLGNHSYHHVQLDRVTKKAATKEVEKANQQIEAWTGICPIYLRPPYGSWSKELEKQIEMIPVFWNVDSLDWKLQNKDKIVTYVMKQIKDGDIILMHDGYQSSIEAAFTLVDRLQKEGFVFVTVEEMLLD